MKLWSSAPPISVTPMALPTVLLHDHLDGGLRPATILDLADELGYDALPETEVGALAKWFDQSESGSLETYLDAFVHTIAVMQTGAALERIAYEAVLDLSADGVAYAEIRFCPALHTQRGLSHAQVVEAISSGMRLGEAETGLKWGLIIDALRQHPWSEEMARVAIGHRGSGVVGFDIAGPEATNPPERHLLACRLVRESGLRLTIHAGEAAGRNGVRYIAAAIDKCGAERLGHGLEIIDDCDVSDGEIVDLGAVARRVRDRQIPLEMCPASNLATNRLTPEQHPIGALYRAGFNITLSTDNRLMSNTSMSSEFDFARSHHGFAIGDLALTTRRSMEAAFCDRDTKAALWEEVLAPAYEDAGAAVETNWI